MKQTSIVGFTKKGIIEEMEVSHGAGIGTSNKHKITLTLTHIFENKVFHQGW